MSSIGLVRRSVSKYSAIVGALSTSGTCFPFFIFKFEDLRPQDPILQRVHPPAGSGPWRVGF